MEANEAGILKVYTFNYRGDLLDERCRIVRDGSLRVVARIASYDQQGNRIVDRSPNGGLTFYTYDHENTDPRARGNILKVEEKAVPTYYLPSRIVQTLTYEPVFHRPKAVRNETGELLRLHYDYEVGAGKGGTVVRIEYPTRTLPDGTSQPKNEHYKYNAHGQLLEVTTAQGHRHIYEYSTSGEAQGYLMSITYDLDGAAEAEKYEYDKWGNRSAVIDGLGWRTEFEYNALRQISRIVRPPIAGVSSEVRFFYTATGAVRREEWPRGAYKDDASSDPYIAHEYAYDVLGRLDCASFGVNTSNPVKSFFRHDFAGNLIASTDALGRKTTVDRDERGLQYASPVRRERRRPGQRSCIMIATVTS